MVSKMKVLKIELTQRSANYKKEETVLNKMTYPLPPFSTVIGAIHNACSYKEYHKMDISIQGKYGALHREPYTDHCFLNGVNDDRGILVKMKNSSFLSTAFDKVAKAKKPQGNSFKDGITIEVLNQNLLEEYRNLKNLSKEIKIFKKTRYNKIMLLIKKRKSNLLKKKKLMDKKSKEYSLIDFREKEIKLLEKKLKLDFKKFESEKYDIPYSRFASLTTSLKYYEILNDIELIIHVNSDEETLNTILDNIYNLQSIGRSEDFVEVTDASIIDVLNKVSEDITSEYSAYIDYNLVKKGVINLLSRSGTAANGTKYYLNKDYVIENSQRIFNKKKVVYASEYASESSSDNLYYDFNGKVPLIVNFI